MEGAAVAVCERERHRRREKQAPCREPDAGLHRGTPGSRPGPKILKYLIIHWKCETAGVSKGTLLERQLVISMEALNSEHQANTLHCVTTIASAGSIYDGLVLRKFLKEIQSILPGFSAKLNWSSEEPSSSQDISGVNEKPRTLMTDSLVIKNFLHKIVMVHPKIRFNFSVKVNGVLSMEIFWTKNEPTLNLSNGISLVISYRHYVSRPKFGTAELLCSRIHPVLGHPVILFIPDDMAGMGFLGELILTPAAALCPCPKVFSNQLNRISSVSIFLYGPSGLPLVLPSQEQPNTTVFKDICYFIDWKKYHLCMVPNLDLSLDRDLVLPDVSYQVESSERDQSQNMDSQGQTLLLFLFVDFQSGFPVQQTELWRVYTLLTAHLSTILTESHSVVQDSIQVAVDQALEQHYQAKAADTQEFGTKLNKSFHEITWHRYLPCCSCEMKQLLPEKNAEQSTEDAHENSSPEQLAGTGGQVENKTLKRGSLPRGMKETRTFPSAKASRQSEAAACRTEPTRAGTSPTSGGSRESPGGGLEDSLWLQEVSNLSEWLNPGPGR
ncbi:type 2 DNA topoisomerase 6 subunit B-like isoform X2 [Vulpes vulpes]|uniref:Type 2 DNA topoisomerase 6 subunit B-like isoform X2 n=1 Tax=Vulpes vulpes TaxID=9627 RepID=A0ABM5AIH5_VULVU